MDLDKAQPSPTKQSRAERPGGDGDDRAEWSVVVLAPVLVAVALWSVPTAIQAGDAGEFATVMLGGGVPHPSGYPWMRLLGLLARAGWALGLPPATAAALPPALCGVAGWLLIHRCCVVLGRPWIGACVIALAASSALVVIHVNDSEVWGPHLLLSAAFVHTVIRTRARPRPFLLGIMLGLAVSHHLTAALLVPLAIAAALPRADPKPDSDDRSTYLRAVARNGGLGLAGSALGLLPYASLAVGRGGAWRWGRVETASGLIDHVLRRDYGTFSLSLHDEPVAASDSVARALVSLGEVMTADLIHAAWVGAIGLLAISALAAAWIRDHPRALDRRIAVGWLLALLASALGFPAAANIDPTSPVGAWILERFDLLTVLLACVPACLAVGWIADRLGRAVGRAVEAQRARRLIGLGGFALAAVLELAQIGAVLERGRPATERAVELAAIDAVSTPDPSGPAIPSAGPVPVRAIVIGTDDHRTFPILYVQEILGAGRHTLYIDAALLAHPWYRARLRERVPTLPDVDKPLALIDAIASDPELAEVPIYLANVFSRPSAKLIKLPEGLLWRVPPLAELDAIERTGDTVEWTPERIVARHLAACSRMRIRPTDFGHREHPRGHPWSADLWFAYVEKTRLLVESLPPAEFADEIAAMTEALERHTGAEYRKP